MVVRKASYMGSLPQLRACIDPRLISVVTPDDLHPGQHILVHLDDDCGNSRQAVPYRGHAVSEAGKRIEGARVAEICAVPRPATGILLQEFLGMVNDARAFVPRLAYIAVPLDALRLVKRIDLDDPTMWTPECEESLL